ncbi:hypothetical protein RhiXN_09036 [Rhizoctonia solani]|uniref:Uncharacterized protein n=1 Tax=Rhizoctonia solani TaxID=456999 RepID=A0A8H8NXB0_9AGAM|nr:uncharacterized protein RhiXN_09036 [Rhizoctonia solani]QRW20061.1 hypothetical protein RhiXN_09036 [Rhizoctonia solani]
MAPIRANQRSTNDSEDPTDTLLAKHSRLITRMNEMFWSPSDVLVLVKKIHRLDDDAELRMRESADPSKKRLLIIADKIYELQPNLAEYLCQNGRPGSIALRDARSRLAVGQSNGRSEDMRKVREEMPKWADCKWDPPLGEKGTRGLHHPQCATLLSDCRVDVTDESAMEQFRAFGVPAMEHSFWERFMYQDGVVDPNNRATGLLRSSLLVKSAKCVLLSPGASHSYSHAVSRVGSRGRSSHHRGLIGIAKSYSITEVNAAFIAYICVVTRHSLTSDEHFSEICAGFNYLEFYNQVREFLEDPKYRRWSKELVEWWNKEVFDGVQLGGLGAAALGREHGTLSMLDAQLETQDLNVGNGGVEGVAA